MSKARKSDMVGAIYAERFRIDAYLDSGVMGSVYRATQLDKNRSVALKVVNAELVDDPEVIKRFHREMKATASIKHPNTVRVHQYGHTAEGEIYLAMELLEGRSLDEVIADEAPMPADRVGMLGAQIASALAAANALGIVHRDLKPENIMVVEKPGKPSQIKVLDFGLARVSDPDSNNDEQLTAYGARVGTPSYMAPEYVSTFDIDHRGDLYSLGVLMYEMTKGKPPFKGGPYEVMHQHVKVTAAPVGEGLKDPPPEWLVTLIERLMAKKPEDRPQTGGEVVDVIARHVRLPVFDAEGGRAASGGPATPAATPTTGRSPLVLAGAALLALALVLAGAGALAAAAAILWGA